ncbi:uncharacterized protein LOC131180638 [Hevea brasiliensis]|uniref:uncharacterized protein LOC131180638 n=1 Tax=Hevea brasiliensis TaxID=3981 RepID=UPI0025D00F67|nr:uncharacterized protein LOC131180638 [Hevea brasiliensis]
MVDSSRARVEEVWSPPVQGTFKINVDASFNFVTSEAGYGFLIRNFGGFIIDGFAAKFRRFSPLVAEGIGLQAAIKFAANRHLGSCLVEIDSLQIKSLLSSLPDLIPWEVAAIIQNQKRLLSCLVNVSISFVPRSANECASWIACAVRNGTLLPGWISNPPAQLVKLLAKDMLNVSG